VAAFVGIRSLYREAKLKIERIVKNQMIPQPPASGVHRGIIDTFEELKSDPSAGAAPDRHLDAFLRSALTSLV
jgi:hypothetical protein